MYKSFAYYAALIIIVWLTALSGCVTKQISSNARVISKSTVFDQKHIYVDITSTTDTMYLNVHGNDIDLDFNNTIIDGRIFPDRPNTFKGVAIHIHDSKNVTIKNLTVHGFKIAILAENVENLKIENCNLSHNYRPRLYSKWDRESLSDWLYYHNNEHDEWKRYGAAIYLKNCDNAIVKAVTCEQGMNGLLMVNSDRAQIYNNNFSFNSGLGIGLYRSSDNWIMHNKLDWNARGYSHGKYARGQDSAAILLYEQSSHNTIAYNSATHSGDGLFLWAGQYTMDTGLGGCDSNVIFHNDFSHSIANGIEVTFSSNLMYENKLNDCRYGIWGGYSHHSEIVQNEISGCDVGIAIEHGNHNIIQANGIADCRVGIQLWERTSQPEDWAYAHVRDVRSFNYVILDNSFKDIEIALEVSGTDSIFVQGNSFGNVINEVTSPLSPSHFINESPSWLQPYWNMSMRADLTPGLIRRPPSELILDAKPVGFPPDNLQGREYIIISEWGPYNFQYPHLVLRDKEVNGVQEVFTFAVFGPEGKWSVKSSSFDSIVPRSGALSDTLVAYRSPDSENPEIILEYTGEQFTDQLGNTIQKGARFDLHYIEREVQAKWDVAYFTFDKESHPIDHYDKFSLNLAGEPIAMEAYSRIAFKWWGEPMLGVPADQFAIRATTDITTNDGEYLFKVESDDGVRLWLDGELILERWDVHTPTIDEIVIAMSAGSHHVELEYFEASGLAVLDISIVQK